ncbi:MAG: translation initiation factor IF-2, partial [Pseudanabaenaceae cyanobacterium]
MTKELNLETKEVMSICQQLDIAVKSHSSTIAEEDAERIRATAVQSPRRLGEHDFPPPPAAPRPEPSAPPIEVRTETRSEARPRRTVPSKTGSEREEGKSDKAADRGTDKGQDKGLNKGQIVTVNLPTGGGAVASPPKAPAKPPVRAVAPAVASAVTPRAVGPTIARPVAPSAMPPKAAGAAGSTSPGSSASEPKKATSPAVRPGESGLPTSSAIKEPVRPQSPREVAAVKPEPVRSRLEAKPEPKPEVKPEVTLVRPPSRPEVVAVSPVAASPAERATERAAVEPPRPKPKLPRLRPQEGLEQTAEERRPVVPGGEGARPKPAPSRAIGPVPEIRPQRPAPVARKVVKDAVLIERGIGAPGETPPVAIPPKRPVPPRPPELEARPELKRSVEIEEVSVLQLRPELPKPPKKLKSRKDEEAEREREKSSTVKTKGKRYFVDEEEDIASIDEELDSIEERGAIKINSLAIARPAARPKNRVAAVANRPTAPAVKKPGESRIRGRDRRQERFEEVIEKPKSVVINTSLTVQELAQKLVIAETDIIRNLFLKGTAVTINQALDVDTAKALAVELGYELEEETVAAAASKTEMLEMEDLENLHRRPPVITIMGHVDHGKTTLLDYIRRSKVAQGEAGGITQHIGAYHVDVERDGQKHQLVFLDTPGHEAFTAMRARGAKVTDLAVLVVAADDGVRPQTVEAIGHAKAAKVPIVVAINKIDKYEAQPERVKQELTEYGLLAEDWGGDTVMVPVSALTGEGVDNLLEMLLLVAEVEDLQANPDRLAKGTIIEAHLDKARGPVATLLVQNGTLRVGDVLVAGPVFGKVRAMLDDRGQRVEAAGPSFAVEVLGLNDVPAAGDEFEVYADEKQARALADTRAIEQRQTRLQQSLMSRRVTLGTLSAKAQEGDLKELNLIIKGDVQGSVEAIVGSLNQLPQ